MPFAAQHIRNARLHLQKNDPVMKSIIKKVGPFTCKTRSDRFRMLVSSIVSQQISTAAASTIMTRVLEATKTDGFNPETLSKFTVDELRALGVSNQKANYILNLSECINSGSLALNKLGRLNDEDVIAELTQVKGIGRWTAQMFLMFALGRMDVLPLDDLGIQNAIRKAYRTGGELTRQKIENIARNWAPYSTVACWYLWQSLEIN